MGFGDHRVGVGNAKSAFINIQEGYARLETGLFSDIGNLVRELKAQQGV